MNNLIRSLYCVLIAFAFISCESEGLDLLLSENSQSEKYEYAIQVAKARYCESSNITRGKDNEARISGVYAILRDDFIPFSRVPLVKEPFPDTLMYVVNFSGNKGFAIVSVDELTKGLLAFIEKGNMQTLSAEFNPGFSIFLDNLRCYFIKKHNSDIHKGGGGFEIPDSLNHPHEFQRTIDTLYTCFLETHWHQRSPLNAFCYHNGVNIPTGCIPVAVGQIVAKNQYPDSFHGFSFNWDYISHDSLPVLSSETAKVAHLLNDLRIITHSDGDTTGHGGDPQKIVNAFDSLGYSHSNLVYYDYNTAKGDFENGRPVLIRGAKENNLKVGHAWVADGIQVSSVHVYNLGSNTFTRLDIRREIHFNWGFGGNFDGYFLSGVFDPDEEGTAFTSYSHETCMIHNIIPANH